MVSPAWRFIGDGKEAYLLPEHDDTSDYVISTLKEAYAVLPEDKQLEIMNDLERHVREHNISLEVKGDDMTFDMEGMTLDEILKKVREKALWSFMEQLAEEDPHIEASYRRRRHLVGLS
jgi:hypothetical protein